MPNITGKAGMINGDYTNIEGAFYIENSLSKSLYLIDTTQEMLAIDASRSNAIYGNSDTVQPPALQLIPQIKY